MRIVPTCQRVAAAGGPIGREAVGGSDSTKHEAVTAIDAIDSGPTPLTAAVGPMIDVAGGPIELARAADDSIAVSGAGSGPMQMVAAAAAADPTVVGVVGSIDDDDDDDAAVAADAAPSSSVLRSHCLGRAT